MFDIGWTELMVIGIVALIVVGPKDLPGMFRTLGKFTAKAKSMAREFTRAMEDAADEAGVKDVAKGLKDATSPTKLGLNKIKEATDEFTKWNPEEKTGAASTKGPETAKLSEERAEAARKIQKSAADKATARLAREKAEAQEAVESAKKPTPKKTASKKAVAKKPAAKTTAKPAAKKAASKAPIGKKPSARKPTAKKATKGTAK